MVVKTIERLQKIISNAGFTSRRGAEKLISQGRVKVDGIVVMQQGMVVDAQKSEILIDNLPLQKTVKKLYFILNKPVNVVSTAKDERKRKTVVELLPKDIGRIYPVGRLDIDTEGLLLLTNDGELTHRLLHPSYRVYKTYVVELESTLTQGEIQKLREGVYLSDGKTARAQVCVLQAKGVFTLKITLHEGKKREIRRMFLALGHRVQKLRRVAFANLSLKGLKTGEYRELTAKEITMLKKITEKKVPSTL